MARKPLELWTWSRADIENEVRRYGNIILYAKRPRDAHRPRRVSVTITASKPRKRPTRRRK